MPESDSDPQALMTAIGTLRASRRWLRQQGPVLSGGLGELSRFGAARMALRRSTIEPRRVGDALLVDHSEQKKGGTQEMFGRDLPVVNPYKCFRGPLLRLLVLIALVLPRRLQREVVAVAVAESLRRQLDESAETFLWNPYNLVGFALAIRLPNPHVYVLAPEYPPVKRSVAVYSNATVLQIQEIPPDRQRLVVRTHAFVSDDVKFVFHLSAASMVESELFEERVLLDLFDVVKNASEVPVEVRLHYHDLEHGIPESLESRIGPYIARDGRLSLNALSTRQVSFSCQSSIGYELLGLNVSHMIIGPRPDGTREHESTAALNAWFATSKFVLPWTTCASEWPSRVAAAYPDRLHVMEDHLLLDGRRIASW